MCTCNVALETVNLIIDCPSLIWYMEPYLAPTFSPLLFSSYGFDNTLGI